jgi:hypothetical protein
LGDGDAAEFGAGGVLAGRGGEASGEGRRATVLPGARGARVVVVCGHCVQPVTAFGAATTPRIPDGLVQGLGTVVDQRAVRREIEL